MSEYREHDPIMQGLYYVRHVEAMTAENLYDKGAIASELAARDILIDTHLAALATLRDALEDAEKYLELVEFELEPAPDAAKSPSARNRAARGLCSMGLVEVRAALQPAAPTDSSQDDDGVRQ